MFLQSIMVNNENSGFDRIKLTSKADNYTVVKLRNVAFRGTDDGFEPMWQATNSAGDGLRRACLQSNILLVVRLGSDPGMDESGHSLLKKREGSQENTISRHLAPDGTLVELANPR